MGNLSLTILSMVGIFVLMCPSPSTSNSSSCKTKRHEISLLVTKACKFSKRSSSFHFNGAKNQEIDVKRFFDTINKLEEDYLKILMLKEIYEDLEYPTEMRNQRDSKNGEYDKILSQCCLNGCTYLDFVPFTNC